MPKIDAARYLVQSAAAKAWFDDATDRLRRAGATQIAVDCFEVTPEVLDKILKEMKYV